MLEDSCFTLRASFAYSRSISSVTEGYESIVLPPMKRSLNI
jgi:hypothetical protein